MYTRVRRRGTELRLIQGRLSLSLSLSPYRLGVGMALKFLNKKGWHTGSLRNIENVWKAEQKHDAEQKKLEELRKQIQEERERSEFRLLQEQASLVPYVFSIFFLFSAIQLFASLKFPVLVLGLGFLRSRRFY